jgi:hypothetical protein
MKGNENIKKTSELLKASNLNYMNRLVISTNDNRLYIYYELPPSNLS